MTRYSFFVGIAVGTLRLKQSHRETLASTGDVHVLASESIYEECVFENSTLVVTSLDI